MSAHLRFVSLMVLLNLCSTIACADDSIVRTHSGSVRGALDNGVIVFKGIPFAAPPIGNLRWRPPESAVPWREVLPADSFKPQCMQVGPPLPTMPVEPVSEDCLYLNVWTPQRRIRGGHPVMVFVHGGQFKRGSPSTPLYWGGTLARTHSVVIINVAYRVGALGFLVHPGLSAESSHHVSGNYGLLDLIAALQWVRSNATAFGGDPRNVTVFGQSAGAWAINKLMVSPLARGLFDRAIAQSGGDMGPTRTPEGMAVLEDAERSGVAFAATFGATSIAELRRTPAEEIAKSTFDGIPEIPHSNAALPVIDGYVIPADTYSLYAAGRQARVPLLLGYNEAEGSMAQQPVEPDAYVTATRQQYGAMANRFLALFPAESPQAAGRSQAALWAENWFGWQMWSWARAHAATSGKNVYFYHFSAPVYNGHGAELPYVFIYPFGDKWIESGQAEKARLVSSYWTQFARTGNPNRCRLPRWPVFDPSGEQAMLLHASPAPGEMPDLQAHRLMDGYMNSLRTQQGK